jgi:hypothetical protein
MENETENPKTIEWYQSQVKELRDIRKFYYELFEDNGSDAYFPDLIKNKLQELKETLKNMYFAYINKDGDFPHSFEEEAVKEYKILFPEEEKGE